MPARPTVPVRKRVEETPSHGGGLSEKAKKRLEEHYKSRNKGSPRIEHLSPDTDSDQMALCLLPTTNLRITTTLDSSGTA